MDPDVAVEAAPTPVAPVAVPVEIPVTVVPVVTPPARRDPFLDECTATVLAALGVVASPIPAPVPSEERVRDVVNKAFVADLKVTLPAPPAPPARLFPNTCSRCKYIGTMEYEEQPVEIYSCDGAGGDDVQLVLCHSRNFSDVIKGNVKSVRQYFMTMQSIDRSMPMLLEAYRFGHAGGVKGFNWTPPPRLVIKLAAQPSPRYPIMRHYGLVTYLGQEGLYDLYHLEQAGNDLRPMIAHYRGPSYSPTYYKPVDALHYFVQRELGNDPGMSNPEILLETYRRAHKLGLVGCQNPPPQPLTPYEPNAADITRYTKMMSLLADGSTFTCLLGHYRVYKAQKLLKRMQAGKYYSRQDENILRGCLKAVGWDLQT